KLTESSDYCGKVSYLSVIGITSAVDLQDSLGTTRRIVSIGYYIWCSGVLNQSTLVNY
ncbi:hypothetical protein EG68_08963, partial [Paragonimus skrjabini miyazakii]